MPPLTFTVPVPLLFIALKLEEVLVIVPPLIVTVPPAKLLTVPVEPAEVMTVSVPEMVIAPVELFHTATPAIGVPLAFIAPTVPPEMVTVPVLALYIALASVELAVVLRTVPPEISISPPPLFLIAPLEAPELDEETSAVPDTIILPVDKLVNPVSVPPVIVTVPVLSLVTLNVPPEMFIVPGCVPPLVTPLETVPPETFTVPDSLRTFLSVPPEMFTVPDTL